MLFGHHFLTPILALNNCALFSIGKYAPREKPPTLGLITSGKPYCSALRQKMQLAPVTQLIPKNKAIKKHLKQQGMRFSTILTDTQKVYLHHKISLKLGSSIEVIDKVKLSDNNKQDLIKILNFFNANILGIDVICKEGIEVDFKTQPCN
jgi:hypothetical protein